MCKCCFKCCGTGNSTPAKVQKTEGVFSWEMLDYPDTLGTLRSDRTNEVCSNNDKSIPDIDFDIVDEEEFETM